METSALIRLLAGDAKVREPFARGLLGAAALSVALTAGLFALALGPRPDIAAAMETARFPFKFVVTGALAVTAFHALLLAGRPEARFHLAPLLAAPLLLAGAALAELAVTPMASWPALMIGENAALCLTLIPLFSAGPLACLIRVSRRGAPARPGRAGALAGLAAGGVAAFFYAANCVDDSPLFVLAWYPVAIGMVALAGYLIGRRALRW
ncbi:NrsF family protein [Amaricoccus solimangrovi]|uniref:DUF1109 family protein n=1 Tax=Amaricoccus solimangrovi TaxID=2589815 RepID=A0A501WID5_9RHOB|nr:NrsF family protein [Amaricoccus solimangrovi]TPE48185.1 DUF1109 family protein [Amaricoccus solimangrovi]